MAKAARRLGIRALSWPSREGGVVVKLAEALSLRANATRRIEQLRARIVGIARYQEGEEPGEGRRSRAHRS
jgi:hypothetical protein